MNQKEYEVGDKKNIGLDVFAIVKENPQLPRVLLIGDSISMGYTLEVRRLLKNKANILRVSENCGWSAYILEHLDQWLGDNRWDLIHFNCGIWDNHTLDNKGNIIETPGQVRTNPFVYCKNLQQIVTRLQQSADRIAWASTTPVPRFAASKREKYIKKYNQLAEEVMIKNNIAINDLYLLTEPHLQRLQSNDKVHFTAEGYDFLAKGIAIFIEKALKYDVSNPTREPIQ